MQQERVLMPRLPTQMVNRWIQNRYGCRRMKTLREFLELNDPEIQGSQIKQTGEGGRKEPSEILPR